MYLSFLLATAILLSWIPKTQRWGLIPLAAFTVAAVIGGQMTLAAALAIAIMAMLIFLSHSPLISQWLRIPALVTSLLLGLVFAVHKFPGFHNLLAINNAQLSERSTPYSLYLNYDKPLFAIFFLVLYGHLIIKPLDLRHLAKVLTLTLVPLLLFVIPIALNANYIAWEPKWPAQSWLWLANNLVFVCVSEEVLFRGVIQKNLASLFKRWHSGEWFAVLVSALLFGAVHFAGGLAYVLLASIAGFFYGAAFNLTRSIEAPILCHFGLNTVHFLLFTYPSLTHL